jgi:cholest-4-en-3-one 26-monooxygenase
MRVTTSAEIPVGFDPTDPDILVDRIPHEEFLARYCPANAG